MEKFSKMIKVTDFFDDNKNSDCYYNDFKLSSKTEDGIQIISIYYNERFITCISVNSLFDCLLCLNAMLYLISK